MEWRVLNIVWLRRAAGWAMALWIVIAPIGAQVEKPWGVFSSSGAMNQGIYDNPNLRGVLVRISWSSIEGEAGAFDISGIERQVNEVESRGLSWSLAINAGGIGAPDWLIDELGAAYVDFTFRGESGYRLPLFWDEKVQERVALLATRLGEAFADKPLLKLVYVSQMTSNGLEGHLQGVDMADMREAGFTDSIWVDACVQASEAFAAAFPEKALAFEVHDIENSSAVPALIIDAFQNHTELSDRMGIAMWWISGKTSYQSELVELLKAYPGDLYGQVIGRSDQPERFQNEDYRSVFAQAQELGMRYIEPWEYEFLSAGNGANGEWNDTFSEFNQWAEARYGSGESGLDPDLASFSVSRENGQLVISWNAEAGVVYKLYLYDEYESSDWQLYEEFVEENAVEIRYEVDFPVGIGARLLRLARP